MFSTLNVANIHCHEMILILNVSIIHCGEITLMSIVTNALSRTNFHTEYW